MEFDPKKVPLMAEVRAILNSYHETDTFRLAICLPTTSHVHAAFMVDVGAMIIRLGLQKIALPWVKKHSILIFNKQSSLIHSSRTMLVKDALLSKATHILFVDSDQTFPPEVVHMLMKHDKMVVGANIVTKEIPARPCAVKADGRICYTEKESSGLEEVAVCGTGLMLINTKLFGIIEPPYFLMPYDPVKRLYLGEDVYFCNRVRAAGVSIYIDHDVSKKVGHIGAFEYHHGHVGDKRQLEPHDELLEAINYAESPDLTSPPVQADGASVSGEKRLFAVGGT